MGFANEQVRAIYNVLRCAMCTLELSQSGRDCLLSHVASAIRNVCRSRHASSTCSASSVADALLQDGIPPYQEAGSAIVVQITVALLLSIVLDKDLDRVRCIMQVFSVKFSQASEKAESSESKRKAASPSAGENRVVLLQDDIIAFLLAYVCARWEFPTLSGVDTLRKVQSNLQSNLLDQGCGPLCKAISAGIAAILLVVSGGSGINRIGPAVCRCRDNGCKAYMDARNGSRTHPYYRSLFGALGLIAFKEVKTYLWHVFVMRPWL